MVDHPFVSQFSTRSLTVSGMLYSTNTVQIYTGTHHSRAVAVKVIKLARETDFAVMEREFAALLSVTHEFIVEMIDAFWVEREATYSLVIVTEQCDSDLGKEYKARKETMSFFPESKLWEILIELVSALSYMQEMQFAHRDIKPENVFLLAGHVKLGDLGSSKYVQPDVFVPETVIGTPAYLSPILKLAMATQATQVVHDVYKSDCYSLGVTMYALATLYLPVAFISGKLTDEAAREKIAKVRYSDGLKTTMFAMVRREEVDRCDFVSLKKALLKGDLDLKGASLHPLGDTVECMVCGAVKYRTDLGPETVAFNCDPANHFICSQPCVELYLNGATIPYTCPRCKAPVPEDFFPRSKLESIRNKSASLLSGLKNRTFSWWSK